MIVSFLDAIEIPAADVCIIGAGPVGLAAALACEDAGLSVLLVESGPLQPDGFSASLSAGHQVDPLRHAAPDIAICRALGGTSRWWGGRCVPFDDIDFADRPHVPDTAWPIPYQEVQRWYADACSFLGIGTPTFNDSPRATRKLDGVVLERLERWTPEIDMGKRHHARLVASRRVTVLLCATVTDFTFSADGDHVTNLTLAAPSKSAVITPPMTVLACGGLETARLMLWVRERYSSAFGGREGALGRNYIGHISGKIANVVLADPHSVIDHDFFLDGGVYCRRRFVITEAVQQCERLLNTAFWLDNPPFHRAGHRSGLLSLVWLALAIPPIGRLVLSEGVRRAHVGSPPHDWARHVLNMLSSPVSTATGILGILRSRFLAKPSKPGFLIRNTSGRYALHYHAEHASNAASHVTLSSRRDALGVPFLNVALEYTDQDAESVVRSHEVLDDALRAAGAGRLDYYLPDRADRVRSALAQAADGFHQAGLTRMSTVPETGVVNPDCRVHGVENLFVAGSSVIPTAGQANPTFVAVALALRLAAHIADATRRVKAAGAAPLADQEAA